MNHTRLLFALISVAALVAGCDSGKQVDDILALTGDATNGATVFSANCASCHGADGKGGSGPNLLSEVGEEQAEFVDTIIGGEDVMPAFGDTLSDQEIADVLAWLEEQAAGA